MSWSPNWFSFHSGYSKSRATGLSSRVKSGDRKVETRVTWVGENCAKT